MNIHRCALLATIAIGAVILLGNTYLVVTATRCPLFGFLPP